MSSTKTKGNIFHQLICSFLPQIKRCWIMFCSIFAVLLFHTEKVREKKRFGVSCEKKDSQPPIFLFLHSTVGACSCYSAWHYWEFWDCVRTSFIWFSCVSERLSLSLAYSGCPWRVPHVCTKLISVPGTESLTWADRYETYGVGRNKKRTLTEASSYRDKAEPIPTSVDKTSFWCGKTKSEPAFSKHRAFLT